MSSVVLAFINGPELVLLLGIVYLFCGPKKFAGLAASLGKAVKELQSALREETEGKGMNTEARPIIGAENRAPRTHEER